MIIRLAPWLLGATLLLSCTVPPEPASPPATSAPPPMSTEPADEPLPGMVRDRIFAAAASAGLNPSRSLGIIDAESQTWNGCYGLATADELCTEVAISGWRAVISDGEQYWVYHTDSTGETVRLNAAASGGTAVPTFIPRITPPALGDETSVQSILRHDSGVIETVMLEADGQLFQIRSRDGEVLERTITPVGQSRIEAMWQRLEQANFAHFDGIRYQLSDADVPAVRLMTRAGVVEYPAASIATLPADLQAVIQQWRALQ